MSEAMPSKITLSNWNENPPLPFTMHVYRKWLIWHYTISMRETVVTRGRCLFKRSAENAAWKILNYAVRV
jgi:hypothetical protein